MLRVAFLSCAFSALAIGKIRLACVIRILLVSLFVFGGLFDAAFLRKRAGAFHVSTVFLMVHSEQDYDLIVYVHTSDSLFRCLDFLSAN
jgi:hypothetical protein